MSRPCPLPPTPVDPASVSATPEQLFVRVPRLTNPPEALVLAIEERCCVEEDCLRVLERANPLGALWELETAGGEPSPKSRSPSPGVGDGGP